MVLIILIFFPRSLYQTHLAPVSPLTTSYPQVSWRFFYILNWFPCEQFHMPNLMFLFSWLLFLLAWAKLPNCRRHRLAYVTSQISAVWICGTRTWDFLRWLVENSDLLRMPWKHTNEQARMFNGIDQMHIHVHTWPISGYMHMNFPNSFTQSCDTPWSHLSLKA